MIKLRRIISIHVEDYLRTEGSKFVDESAALEESVPLTVLYLQLYDPLTFSKI
jgi:hypothetical protein